MHDQVSPERFAVSGDRSRAAVCLLGAAAAAALALAAATFFSRGSVEERVMSFDAQVAALVFANALQIVGSVAVAVWVHRAYANLRTLRHATLYTPFAAAAYFLIPGANFIVPHIVLREVWSGSDVSEVRTLTKPPSRPVNVVTLWWYLFIVSAVTSNVAAAMMMHDAHSVRVDRALIASAVCAAAAAVVGMDVIRLVDTRQALLRRAQVTTDVASVPREPRPIPAQASAWRSVLLPVVTAVERDMANDPAVPDEVPPPPEPAVAAPAQISAPSIARELPPKGPRKLVRPRALPTAALFSGSSLFAVLQALVCIPSVSAVRDDMPLAGVMFLVLPFSWLVYVFTLLGAIAFCVWLSTAYGNLRMYEIATVRPPHTAVRDFIRGFGSGDVLEELWLVTMALRPDDSLSVVDRWRSAWRILLVSAAVTVVLLVLQRQRFAVLAVGVMFLAWAWASALARTICLKISHEQAERLTREKPEPAADPPRMHETVLR